MYDLEEPVMSGMKKTARNMQEQSVAGMYHIVMSATGVTLYYICILYRKLSY